MPRQQKDQSYDALSQLKDAGLVAASAAATVGGVAKIQDLGLGRVDARLIVDTTAVESATGDELFSVCVQLSNDAGFAAGNVNAVIGEYGAAATTGESAVSPAISRRELGFCNEVNGTLYRYCRVFTKVAGTIATGINFTAFIAEKA